MRTAVSRRQGRSIVVGGWYAVAMLAGALALFFLPMNPPAADDDGRMLLDELARGVPIKQTFVPPADGLHSVRVQIWAPEPADATLDFQLSLTRPDGITSELRGTRRVDHLSGFQWVAFDFPEVDRSAGANATLIVHASAVTSPRVALVGTRERPIAAGKLWVGDQGRWGRLNLSTSAVGDTVSGRFALSRQPRFPVILRVPAVALAGLIVYSLLLLPLFSLLLTESRVEHASSQTRTRRAALLFGLIIGLLIVSTLGVVVWAARADRPMRLVDRLGDARLETTGPLHERIDVMNVGIDFQTKRCIFAHSTSTMSWTLVPETGARLTTALALAPGIWDAGGDGVLFRVVVQDAGRVTELARRDVNPHGVPADRHWIPIEADLSPYAGHQIQLTLLTEPSPPGVGPDASYDWALWGEPTVMTGTSLRQLEWN
jgi:hypothetical protein